jgi:hypothetical protein
MYVYVWMYVYLCIYTYMYIYGSTDVCMYKLMYIYPYHFWIICVTLFPVGWEVLHSLSFSKVISVFEEVAVSVAEGELSGEITELLLLAPS